MASSECLQLTYLHASICLRHHLHPSLAAHWKRTPHRWQGAIPKAGLHLHAAIYHKAPALTSRASGDVHIVSSQLCSLQRASIPQSSSVAREASFWQASCHTWPFGESNIFRMSAADFLGGVARLAFITPVAGALFGAGLLLEGPANGSSDSCCAFCSGAASFSGDGDIPTAKGSASPPDVVPLALLCTPQYHMSPSLCLGFRHVFDEPNTERCAHNGCELLCLKCSSAL